MHRSRSAPSSRSLVVLALIAIVTVMFASEGVNLAQSPVSPVNFGQPSSGQPVESENPAPVAAIAATQSPVTGGLKPGVGAAGDMIGFSHSDGSGTQTITLVDTSKSWMAVYHIDRSGKIRLVSSRPIEADFSLQLNATAPLPEDIRQLGGR